MLSIAQRTHHEPVLGRCCRTPGRPTGRGRSSLPAASASTNTAHADAMHLLGVIELQRGRPGEAEVLILAALTHRKDSGFMTDLGVTLGCQGKLSASEAAFRKALELNPDLAEAHHHLGILLVQTQRAAEAEAAFRRVG